MSNVIKAFSVRCDDEVKMTIDTHLRIDKQIEKNRGIAKISTEAEPDGFVEGLQALVVETLPNDEETQETAFKIIEDAKEEAKRILEQAKQEAEQLRSDALTTAQKKGYDEGMLQVRKEAQKLKAELEEKSVALQNEYDTIAESLEPQMVRIIAALVEKITGIVVQDKEEVILYLVNKALKNMDKSDEYTIRVSKEDYEYISMRKNLLLGALGRDVSLYITEDINLNKNQCLIETELKVINCSLDVQLNNLITDLKLIGGI